jgi:hypothetical protein
MRALSPTKDGASGPATLQVFQLHLADSAICLLALQKSQSELLPSLERWPVPFFAWESPAIVAKRLAS